jgi:hypothetical protein
MARYDLDPMGNIRRDDGAYVPRELGNADYQDFLKQSPPAAAPEAPATEPEIIPPGASLPVHVSAQSLTASFTESLALLKNVTSRIATETSLIAAATVKIHGKLDKVTAMRQHLEQYADGMES